MLEKTLESPLDCKEIQPVHSKGEWTEYPLEGLMLKLKLQYFGLPAIQYERGRGESNLRRGRHADGVHRLQQRPRATK